MKLWRRRDRRYYGDGTTLHDTGHVDVEIGPDGHVCAVWFRCRTLAFQEHRVTAERAADVRHLEGIELSAVYVRADGAPERG